MNVSSSYKRLPLCSLVCAALLSTAPWARAQDTGDVLALEEVIVTAQRIEESANDVGMDIQTLTGQQLDQLNITNVADLTAVIPSFTLAQSYQGVPTYTLRGIGFYAINMSAKSTVGTYIDQLAYPYPIMNAGPIFDLQRVEVLKGPQGTLFGRNTTAGLINLVTNKPIGEFEAMLRGEVGNYGTTNFEGMVNVPLGDRLAGRLAVRTESSSDGWQESNARGEDLGEVDRYALRAALAFQPTDSLAIDVFYNGWRNESDTLAAQAIALTPSTAVLPTNAPGLVEYVAANQPDDGDQADWTPRARRSQDIGTGLGLPGDLAEDSRLHSLKLNVEYEFDSDLRLVSLTGYHDLERKGLIDFSGAPYEILLQDLDGDIESFSQELRLEGETDRMKWLLGAYYAKDDLVDANRTMLGENANVPYVRGFGLTLLGTDFNSGGYTPTEMLQAFRTYEDHADIDVRSWSVFANANWELTDRLSLTTGVRYTEDEQDYGGCSRDFNGNMLPNVNVVNRFLFLTAYGVLADEIGEGDCNTFDTASGTFGLVESELDEDNVSWRLALEWSPTDDTLLFGSVTQGYKSGETPVNAANIAIQNAPVKQENLLAYELGVKATLFDGRMQANAAAFFYDYEDKQLSVYFADPIYTTLSRLANIPDSEAYGMDAEVSWRLTSHFTVIGALTLLETEVQDYQGIDVAGQPTDFDGAPFLFSPDTSGTLTLFYDRELSSSLGMSANLGARYQSESWANLEQSDTHKIDSYTLVSAGIGIHALDRRWDLSLWADNLTDEYYWLQVTQNANTIFRFPGKTRTYGATFTYRF